MHGFVKDFASRSIKLRCIYIRAIAFFDNWFLWKFYSKVGGFEFKFIPIMSMVLSWVCSRSNKCHLRSIQASGDIRHQITCLHISTFSYVHKMLSFLVILHLALCNYHIRLFRRNCMWHPPPRLPDQILPPPPPPDLYMKYITDYIAL